MQPVASSDAGQWHRSRVLGLELRSRRQARGTVLVLRDPRTGEETAGALEEAERRRRIAERDSRAANQRANAAEERANAAQQEASAAKQAEIAAKQAASVADERVRALEEQLRALTARTTPGQRDR